MDRQSASTLVAFTGSLPLQHLLRHFTYTVVTLTGILPICQQYTMPASVPVAQIGILPVQWQRERERETTCTPVGQFFLQVTDLH